MAHAFTGINKAVCHSEQTLGAGSASGVPAQPTDVFSQTVKSLLGSTAQLAYSMNLGTMDQYTGSSRSTTGIPVAISGTARVISQNVSRFLTGFEDPIKAALTTTVVEESRVIIKRKYVVGGSSLIVPEHAPARTVSVREDQREVVLTRYGGDIEMNLNLFLRPDDAREELEMKLDAQRDQLQQVLVSLGYERIFNEGTAIVAALQRSSALSGSKSAVERAVEAERIYSTAIFGAMSKNDFPLPNIFAILAKSQIYTPNTRSKSGPALMIVPPGTFDLSQYTRESTMNFSISGLKSTEHGSISMPLSNVFVEPNTGVKVMVHVPPVSNANGAANPQVEANELQRSVGIATYYPVPAAGGTICITDFKNRDFAEITISVDDIKGVGGDATDAEVFLMRPQMTCLMESAIVVNEPGQSTGSLLVGYPSTAISTSQTQEMMRIQLRTYMGAMLVQPENVTILNDIKHAGLVGGHGSKCCKDPQTAGSFKPWTDDGEGHDLFLFAKKKTTKWHELFLCDPVTGEAKDKTFYKCTQHVYAAEWEEAKDLATSGDATSKVQNHFPVLPYRGAVFASGPTDLPFRAQVVCNEGHLRHLDHPSGVDVLEGMQVYRENPRKVKMSLNAGEC